MCGRFTQAPNVAAFYDSLGGGFHSLSGVPPQYNLAPTQFARVARFIDGVWREQQMRWGLVPARGGTSRNNAGWINARSETADALPAFKTAFAERRLVVPASGFFEWEKRGRDRLPRYFIRNGDLPMAFAGLWEPERAPVEYNAPTFAILTCAANGIVRPYHDRMPVILENSAEVLAWSDPAATLDELKKILRPLPDAQMREYRVSTQVNNVKNQGVTLIKPVPEERLLF